MMPKYGRSFVSILVLLEIALEEDAELIFYNLNSSFNPCSIGNCSGRRGTKAGCSY